MDHIRITGHVKDRRDEYRSRRGIVPLTSVVKRGHHAWGTVAEMEAMRRMLPEEQRQRALADCKSLVDFFEGRPHWCSFTIWDGFPHRSEACGYTRWHRASLSEASTIQVGLSFRHSTIDSRQGLSAQMAALLRKRAAEFIASAEQLERAGVKAGAA